LSSFKKFPLHHLLRMHPLYKFVPEKKNA
jgi:hypothetical protein